MEGGRGGLSDLPEALLVKIFEGLELLERHCTLPFVCRHWAELVHSPSLLLQLHIPLRRAYVTPRYDALCAFLSRQAAGHVHHLSLQLAGGHPSDDGTCDALLRSLAACSAGGQLTSLTISLEGASQALHVSGPLWAAACASLCQLGIAAPGQDLVVGASLAALTSLQSLSLHGSCLRFLPATSLPASLTALELCPGGWQSSHSGLLPEQLTALTQLQVLRLEGDEGASTGYSLLAQLPTVRSLELVDCLAIPSCLSQLTQLEALVLLRTPFHSAPKEAGMVEGEAARALAAELAAAVPALCCLQRLTRLQMRHQAKWPSCGGRQAQQLPANGLAGILASLPALQRLEWPCWLEGPAPAPLPAGAAALGSLRRLHAPARALASSLAALSEAGCLEDLELLAGSSDAAAGMMQAEHAERDAVHAVLRWAPHQPALQRVVLHMPGAMLPFVFDASLEAQRRKPALHMQWRDNTFC